jgi:hypothetical protein
MNDKPQAIQGLEFHPAGNEVLVHDSQRRKIHVLNHSAAAVLRACDGTHDIEALAHVLTHEPSPEAYDDAARIVAEFRELGLVVARPVAQASI